MLDVLKIKRVIELRLFKTAGVFVGANRRTGCKVFGGRVRTICLALSSNFNFLRRLAVIFEDYACIFACLKGDNLYDFWAG